MARLTSRAPMLVVFLVHSSLHALAIATFLPAPVLLNHPVSPGLPSPQDLIPGLPSQPSQPANNHRIMPPLPRFRNTHRRRSPFHMSRVAQAHEFLNEHNRIRAELGEPPLVWDGRLARYAQKYANRRKNDCALEHSPGELYGENIYWGEHFELHSAATAVRYWLNETRFYDQKTHTCAANQVCGHYTQIIWRSTKRIGCARVQCRSGGVFTICEYDPPGNYKNEDPLTSIA